MRLVQWLLWKRNRIKRVQTFRTALKELPKHTLPVTWYWDHIRQAEVAETKLGNLNTAAYYTGQRRLMEWLLNGAPIGGRPYCPSADPQDGPDHPSS